MYVVYTYSSGCHTLVYKLDLTLVIPLPCMIRAYHSITKGIAISLSVLPLHLPHLGEMEEEDSKLSIKW